MFGVRNKLVYVQITYTLAWIIYFISQGIEASASRPKTEKGLARTQMYNDDRPHAQSKFLDKSFLPFHWHKSLVVTPKMAKIYFNPHKSRHRRAELLSRHARNLHEPIFDSSEYQLSVNENITVNSSILTVRATDDDVDEHGVIRYDLRDTNHFWIDQNGVIYTKIPLDYESSGGQYRFTVVATNPSSDSQGTQVPVIIRIRDTPEAPQFDSNSYSFSISEFSSVGDYVGTVVARDPDNDFREYSLVNVNPQGMFAINQYNGIIKIDNASGFPDYVYNFQAVATDQQGHRNQVPVTVNIIAYTRPVFAPLINKRKDENTNKPIFENCSGYNNFMVLESQHVPHPVIMVKATDADHGMNGKVMYYLLNDPPQFEIDKESGQLSVRQMLDRDSGPKTYYLTVIAKDKAENPLQNSCPFAIVVGDINDNPPIFDSDVFVQTVPSDTLTGTRLLRLTASDADAGPNAEVKYSLQGTTEDLQYFNIDETSGLITLAKGLSSNMANHKTFELRGKAIDGGTPPLYSMVDVKLEIVTAGNMPPSVVSQTPQRAKIPEDADRNTNIVSLCTKSNSESSIVYMDLANGQSPESNSEGTFDIRTAQTNETGCPQGQVGGNIFLATPNLDYEEIQSYTITVQLTNNKGARSEHSLDIIVVDVNDNPPVLQEPYSGSVSENSEPRTLVMHIKTIDKDNSPQYRQLKYSFKDPNQLVTSNFFIDNTTGELWTNRSLDREQQKQYRIPIEVTDGVNVRDRQYWVVVNDQNDEPPIFNRDKGIYETKIYENLSVGKDTGIKLVVEDPDILNEFSYQIVEGNEQKKFYINTKSGTLTINRPLDYDSPVNDRNFTLQIRVSDGKSYNTTEVNIAVLNVNDMPPEFDRRSYSVQVTENTDCDTNVTRVFAHDPDYPNGGDVVYFISQDEQRNFTINKKTGDISVIGCLDRETVSPFGLLTINPFAYDEGGSGLNSETTHVEITIRDVNDNHPYIESPPQARVGIMENVSPENAPKTTIQLNDWDSDAEGNGCPCSLAFDKSTPAEVMENFDVIEENGSYSLIVRKSLDREQQKVYNIPFRTTDRKGLSGIRNLVVTVGDQNDSPMSDGESKITVYNYKTSFPDIMIGFVYVTDADDHDVDDKNFELDALTSPIAQTHFTVDINSGNLTMRRGTPAGQYTVVVKVTDNARKEEALATVHVTVIDLPEEAVMRSGSFLVSGMSAYQMMSQTRLSTFEGTSIYDRLKMELSSVYNVPPANVDIFTLLDVTKDNVEGVEVRFNVHNSPYYTANHLNGLLQQNRNQIESNLGIKIPVIDYNLCLYENYKPCNGSSCQQELRADSRHPLVIAGETSTVVGVKVSQNYSCMCGHLDPEPKACPDNYCLNNGKCNVNLNGTLSCSCLDSYNYGPRCELLTARLKGGYAWFEPLGSCENPTLHLTFQSEHHSALLLYNGPLITSPGTNYPKDFLYLIMRNWEVEAYIDLGGGTHVISVKVKKNFLEPYDVLLSWSANHLKMNVSNCGYDVCSKSVRIFSDTSLLNVGGPLQLGGLAPMVPLSALGASYKWDMQLPTVDSFDGCISRLQYNNVIYDMNMTSYYKYYSRTCAEVVVQPQMKMSNESVFIIVGSLLILMVMVLLILVLLRRRKKAQSYPENLNEVVKETIGQTDIEGYGEKDMTHFDLKCLRVTQDGHLLNGHAGIANLPDVTKQNNVGKAPLASINEGFGVGEFITDNRKKIDKEMPDFDNVRHYCYEGDEMSIASLSSLGSGTSTDDQPYNCDDWGPRFKQLADIYRPQPDEEEDSEYEFPNIPNKTVNKPKIPHQFSPSSSSYSSDKEDVPYQRMTDRLPGEYHETVNPLSAYDAGKESWC